MLLYLLTVLLGHCTLLVRYPFSFTNNALLVCNGLNVSMFDHSFDAGHAQIFSRENVIDSFCTFL